MPLACEYCSNEVKDNGRYMLMCPDGSIRYFCSPACVETWLHTLLPKIVDGSAVPGTYITVQSTALEELHK